MRELLEHLELLESGNDAQRIKKIRQKVVRLQKEARAVVVEFDSLYTEWAREDAGTEDRPDKAYAGKSRGGHKMSDGIAIIGELEKAWVAYGEADHALKKL